MPKFATAADSLTTALAIVDSRLTNIDINEQLELYLELIQRRANIQQAIAGSGGVADTTATGTITTQNLVPTGVATAGSDVSIDLDSKGTVTIQVTGTYTGDLSAQITTDGTNWVTPTNTVFKNMVTGANSATIPSASVGIWQIEVIGHAKFRLSALAAVTGTATIALRAAADTSQVSVAGVSTAVNQNTGNASLASIDTKTPALGQALAASSVPVVLTASQLSILTPLPSVGITSSVAVTGTFFQATQPVSAVSLPLPTGASTSVLQTTGNGSLSSIDNKLILPSSLGAKTAANSLSVTQAFAATSTLANVASSATSVSLLAANNNRKTAIIINDSTSDLYVTLNASAASTTNYSLFLVAKVGNIPSSLILKGDDYSGEIRGIWSSANGFARITEVV